MFSFDFLLVKLIDVKHSVLTDSREYRTTAIIPTILAIVLGLVNILQAHVNRIIVTINHTVIIIILFIAYISNKYLYTLPS